MSSSLFYRRAYYIGVARVNPIKTARQASQRHRNTVGLTLLEILVALSIFSVVSVSILSGLTSGDRLRRRGTRLQSATHLASNLAEQIRAQAYWSEPVEPGDSTYEEMVGSLVFEVERTVHDTTPFPRSGSSQRNREITIHIRLAGEEDTLANFRLVQGYLQ
ncbi:MAG: prepilin-type N-terminal cleavage/methylation domain-containing protein [Chitinivibrionales bacterium]|nr:prepilin-type N-terminal cleavage/methylation domain-containing protein [Chitinivibrionales bacterium]MBD3355941.1 prepilin-type N-terminal cleavage/methylation domain-containing protein [Chitinivibrionales bacterium]